MGPSRRSIRFWLALLTLTAVLPLAILVAWLFVTQLRSEQAQARDMALRLAQEASAKIRTMHSDSTILLERMSVRRAIRAADAADCDSLFAIVDFFPQYLNLFLLDASGTVICSAAVQPGDQPASDRAQSWIEEETRSGRLVHGKPAIRFLEKQWVSALAEPVLGTDGVRVGTLVLLQLPDLGRPASLPHGAVVTIVDDHGMVLARSVDPETWTGRSVRGSEVTTLVLSQHEGRAEAAGVDGVQRQYGFTRMPEVGWHLYVGVPTSTVMQPVRTLFMKGLIAGSIIIVAAILAAFALSRFVEKPINALARAAGSISREGYIAPVPVDGPREIAELGAAFNEMVESRSQAEARIMTSERNLKALSDRLLTVQEEERTRIAREIHDDLGQALTALKMDIGGLLRASPTSDATGPVRDRILRTLDSTVGSVQRLSAELRPSVLDDLGLVEAIEGEARLFEERTGIECDVSMPAEGLALEGRINSAIYRIVQESLTNVARHSDASRVEIRLRLRESDLLLEVRDDGRGIRSEEIEHRASLGLIGIRERAAIAGGTVHFEGIEGRGTIVSVRIPVGSARE